MPERKKREALLNAIVRQLSLTDQAFEARFHSQWNHLNRWKPDSFWQTESMEYSLCIWERKINVLEIKMGQNVWSCSNTWPDLCHPLLVPEVDRQFCQGNWESLSLLLLCMVNNKTFLLFFAWSWQWIILELFAMLTAPILPIQAFTIRMEICISTVCTDTDSQAFQRTPVTQLKDLCSLQCMMVPRKWPKIICALFLPFFRLKHCYICHRLTSDLHWQL